MTRARRMMLAAVAVPVALAAALLGVSAFADTPVEDSVTFKNVKVLTDVHTKTQMRSIMKEQAASLGVKCVFCHVPGKFDLDDKKEKVKARDMLKMVSELNSNWLKDSEKKPAVSCWTCHRGSKEPEHAIPPEKLAEPDVMK